MLSLAFCHVIPNSSLLNTKTTYGALNGVFVMAGILLSFATEQHCCCEREEHCPVGGDRCSLSESTGAAEVVIVGSAFGSGDHDATKTSTPPSAADVAGTAGWEGSPGGMEATAKSKGEARDGRKRLFDAEATEVPITHAHNHQRQLPRDRHPMTETHQRFCVGDRDGAPQTQAWVQPRDGGSSWTKGGGLWERRCSFICPFQRPPPPFSLSPTGGHRAPHCRPRHRRGHVAGGAVGAGGLHGRHGVPPVLRGPGARRPHPGGGRGDLCVAAGADDCHIRAFIPCLHLRGHRRRGGPRRHQHQGVDPSLLGGGGGRRSDPHRHALLLRR